MVMVVGGNRQQCSRPCRLFSSHLVGDCAEFIYNVVGTGGKGGKMYDIYVIIPPSSIRCMMQQLTQPYPHSSQSSQSTQPTPAKNRLAREIRAYLISPPPPLPPSHPKTRPAGQKRPEPGLPGLEDWPIRGKGARGQKGGGGERGHLRLTEREQKK